MKKDTLIPIQDIVICNTGPNKIPQRNYFYLLTGGKKETLSLLEYSILRNPDDLEMYGYYYYLMAIIQYRFVPIHPCHFKIINTMLTKIESKKNKILKKQEKEKQLVKKKEKK